MTPTSRPIRVLVADDTPTVRLLLRRTLEASEAFEVVGEAADGAQAVDMAATLKTDMVLLDLSMPVLGGMEAIPRIRRCAPGARVVVLSGFTPDHKASEAVEVGAAAFIEKQQRPDELVAKLLHTWQSTQPPVPEPSAMWAFEHAPLAMALVGLDDRFRYVNPAWCRLSGYGAGHLATLTLDDLTHPEDRDGAAAARRAVAAGAPPTTVDVRLVRPDGRTVWASVSIGSGPPPRSEGRSGPPPRSEGRSGPAPRSEGRSGLAPRSEGRSGPADHGDDPYLVVQMVDISEQKRVEGELSRSNAELSSFAYLAAHELKSPLQALSGFAALLERVHGPELDDQGREFISWIIDGAFRMDALVEDLLTYCSVDTDETVLAPVALDGVVADVLGQLDCEITSRGAIVTVDPLPLVTGDPVQLVQLLQNLLANALKFVPDGRRPQIHVVAARHADAWTVTVADNGIGVDDAARERIFTMFERLHPRDRYKGTGIGLSICKRIVERRGGTIWVEPNPTGGSRFRFTLPDVPEVPEVVASTRSLPAA